MAQAVDFRWLRVEQIIGRDEVTPEQAAENRKHGRRPRRPRAAITPIIPISKSSWEVGIRTGRFPPGRKIGRVRVWSAQEIADLARSI